MPSLQIRELPKDVYEVLAYRAQRDGRSLAQQAIIELRKVVELEARARRMETIERLRLRLGEGGERTVSVSPEEWIRQDRER